MNTEQQTGNKEDTQNINALLQGYFDGLYEGDVKKLRDIFHDYLILILKPMSQALKSIFHCLSVWLYLTTRYVTMVKITIEAIHDLVCSWCPIGRSNLKAALKILDKQIEVEIKYLPFELNPDMPPEGETIETHLMQRNGWTKQQFMDYRTDLIGVTKEAGLVYDFSKRTHYYNTAKAHRLVHFAQAFKKQDAVVDALTEQYFTQGVNLSEDKNLLDIATSVGLDREQVERALSKTGIVDVSENIQHKYDRVREFAVGSVPAFIVNGTEFVQGVNSVDFFVQYLSRFGKGSQSKAVLS